MDLITAFIFRYLWDSIFSTFLGNTVPEVVDVLDNIEDSLNTRIHPEIGKQALDCLNMEGTI